MRSPVSLCLVHVTNKIKRTFLAFNNILINSSGPSPSRSAELSFYCYHGRCWHDGLPSGRTRSSFGGRAISDTNLIQGGRIRVRQERLHKTLVIDLCCPPFLGPSSRSGQAEMIGSLRVPRRSLIKQPAGVPARRVYGGRDPSDGSRTRVRKTQSRQ